MKKTAIGISALALAIAGTAYAAHHGGKPNADADGNGVITRAEMQAHSSAMFARLDANSDGKLDQTDRDVRRQERRTMMFDRLDANSDGSISRDEFMSAEGHGNRGHRMRGDDGKDGDGEHHRWGRRGGMMSKMADANNDGVVTQAEFTAASERHFASMDANGDGQVTKEEREAHHQNMRAKWRDRNES